MKFTTEAEKTVSGWLNCSERSVTLTIPDLAVKSMLILFSFEKALFIVVQ